MTEQESYPIGADVSETEVDKILNELDIAVPHIKIQSRKKNKSTKPRDKQCTPRCNKTIDMFETKKG